jgi:D-sedoheptulose 7-phosphate isomerase
MAAKAGLEFLYPGLAEASPPAPSDTAMEESIAAKADDSRKANERFFDEQGPALVAAARALAEVYRTGGRLLAMGNGGSSCDAAHVAVEFVHPVTAGRPALSALNLGADLAALSAVGNDVGFEHVFTRQLIALGRRGDALIGFSTSGSSANLLRAFARAREMGIVTLGFAGGDGGEMARAGTVEHLQVVHSSSIHRIQECHVTAYHILWDLVHTLLAADRGPGGDA